MTEPHQGRPRILQERESTHGDFRVNARVSQALKELFWAEHVGDLCPVHKECLDMIALKLSRILSGQANFKDHWDDVAGYAQLASEACERVND